MKDIDQGPNPFVINIEDTTLNNPNYRTTLWTGVNLQLTVMSIEPGHDIGLEIHSDHDQFLRIESGIAKVQVGPAEDDLQEWTAGAKDAVLVPANSWHNLTNIGDDNLKVYSIYSPPQHAHGTIHTTKAEADEAEEEE